MSSDLKMKLLISTGKTRKSKQTLRVADDLLQESTYRKDALFAKALALERLNRIAEANAEMSRLCLEYLQDPMFKVASKRVEQALNPLAFSVPNQPYVPGFLLNRP